MPNAMRHSVVLVALLALTASVAIALANDSKQVSIEEAIKGAMAQVKERVAVKRSVDMILQCSEDEMCDSLSPEGAEVKTFELSDIIEIKQVPRIDIGDKEFAKEIIAAGKPVVLENSMVHKKWPAMKKWNYKYITDTLGFNSLLGGVFKSKNHTIWLYRTHQDAYHWPDVPMKYEETEVSVGSFIAQIQAPEQYGYLYFSQPVENLGDKLEKDIAPYDWLVADKNTPVIRPFWVGSAGVTTQMHYDLNYNFHVQVFGEKHFLLFPPEEHEKVYLFPRIHPHHRRSQIDLDHIDINKFPRFLAAKGAMEVTLKAGDILYLPPFWFHHVTNLDAGVSVNTWSDPDLKAKSHALFKAVLSIPKHLEIPVRIQTAKYFLTKLFRLINMDLSDVVKRLYETRYKVIMETLPVPSKPHEDDEKLEAILKTCSKVPAPSNLKPDYKKQLDALAAKASKTVLNLPEGAGREIMLFDYLDSVGLSVVSLRHKMVGMFFADCFPAKKPAPSSTTPVDVKK